MVGEISEYLVAVRMTYNYPRYKSSNLAGFFDYFVVLLTVLYFVSFQLFTKAKY